MAKEKRSFFGKIMGGSVTDEEPQQVPVAHEEVEEEQVAVEVEEEELVPENVEEEPVDMEDEESESPEIDTESQAETEAPKKSKEAGDDWMADYEGQLNIDMYQTKDNVIIKSTIAGVRPEDIDITVANDMVTVKGSRRKEDSIPQDDYFYQECYWGSFSRSVIIPVDIDSENIEADLKDGILTVVIPKAAKAKTKKVKVKGL